MNELEIAKTYMNVSQLAKVKNSFVNYKKFGGHAIPKLQIE